MSGKWRWNTAQFAERKWWQNYLKNKDVKEYLIWKKNYWQQLLNRCLPFISISPSDKILDAGCGPAGIFMLFPENETTAYDPLIESYENDLPHFNTSMYPNVHFVKSGLEDFIPKEKFDTIFCMNAINHVHDIDKSYDNLMACGHTGSFVIITIDAHNHSLFKFLFRLLPGDILHPHQYDLAEYKKLMTDRNCEILATEHLKHEFFFNHYMLIGRIK
jgi:2-polyprenyl-6-hydroxyphenyl methylase/3-demethylubiquinone-9 3-methyltransferase